MRVINLAMAGVISVEFVLFWLSMQAKSASEQSGLLLFSVMLLPLVAGVIFLTWAPPPKPVAKPSLELRPFTIPKPGVAPTRAPKAVAKAGPVKITEAKHSWETPLIVRRDTLAIGGGGVGPVEKPATSEGLVPKTVAIFSSAPTKPVPSIIPSGLVKPEDAGPKEKYASIVPRSAGVKAPIASRPTIVPQISAKPQEQLEKVSRRLEFHKEEKVNYEALKVKAKGMKFSLTGWWPLGWSRVITDPELPAQFWKLQEGKVVSGVLVGYDVENSQYVAWMARIQDGLFSDVHEMARSNNEQDLIKRVKELLREVDHREAEHAHEAAEEK
ncbi:MAG: hypothetical protein AB1476_02990 [Candidatus Hadarchaeota archaeon]